jgi:hypothetical protein
MIFPGMDPYLEDPQLWPGVHASLIVYIRDHLQPLLRPRYLASIEERVYLEGPDRDFVPDVRVQQHRPDAPAGTAVLDCDTPLRVRVAQRQVHETYLALLDRQSSQRVVAVLEVLSPTNKYAGPGRSSYLAKQAEVLRGDAHLLEIDLLRTGPHVLAVPEHVARMKAEYDYLVSVNRAAAGREEFELYPRRLPERLPRVAVPLAEGDPDVPLDLQAVVAHCYEAGCYADRLAYDRPCVPALSPQAQTWSDQLIAASRKPANGPTPAEASG